MELFRFKKDWDNFNALPEVDELDVHDDLPPMDDSIYNLLCKIEVARENSKILKVMFQLSKIVIDRVEEGIYDFSQAQAVFRFACQVARYNGFYLDEYCKNEAINQLFFHTFYEIFSFEGTSPESKINDIRFILKAAADKEEMIQKFSAGVFDYRTEYVFIAKLFKDPRLWSYFLNALRFYESVPDEELILDRETDIENIIDAMGNFGWEEFAIVIEKYLYIKDEVIPYTTMKALGRIGGYSATLALKKFRRHMLENFVEADNADFIEIDLNIALAERGARGVIEEVSGKDTNWKKIQIAIHLLSGIKEDEVLHFLYKLLDDEHFEDIEIYYDENLKRYVFEEIHFPIREEAMTALESYDESYVVSVLGEKYLKKRNSFYLDIERYFLKKGLDKYPDDDQDQ